MGCGCKQRKEEWQAKLRERGHERAARALDAVPDPEQVANAVRRGVRRVIQVTPFRGPPVPAQEHERDRPRRTVLRAAPLEREEA